MVNMSRLLPHFETLAAGRYVDTSHWALAPGFRAHRSISHAVLSTINNGGRRGGGRHAGSDDESEEGNESGGEESDSSDAEHGGAQLLKLIAEAKAVPPCRFVYCDIEQLDSLSPFTHVFQFGRLPPGNLHYRHPDLSSPLLLNRYSPLLSPRAPSCPRVADLGYPPALSTVVARMFNRSPSARYLVSFRNEVSRRCVFVPCPEALLYLILVSAFS